MIAKEKVFEFLNTIQWSGINKTKLELTLSNLFGVEMTLYNSTYKDFKEVDYSFITTNTKRTTQRITSLKFTTSKCVGKIDS